MTIYYLNQRNSFSISELKSSDLKFSALVFGVVKSVPFQYRRGDGRRIYD